MIIFKRKTSLKWSRETRRAVLMQNHSNINHRKHVSDRPQQRDKQQEGTVDYRPQGGRCPLHLVREADSRVNLLLLVKRLFYF